MPVPEPAAGLPPAELGPTSAERLARLGKRFPDRLDEIAALCRVAPDPDLALAGVEQYVDGAGAPPADRELLETLVLLAGSSRIVPALLARNPRLLRRAGRAPWLSRPRPEADLQRPMPRPRNTGRARVPPSSAAMSTAAAGVPSG